MQVSGRAMYPLNGGVPATQVGETAAQLIDRTSYEWRS